MNKRHALTVLYNLLDLVLLNEWWVRTVNPPDDWYLSQVKEVLEMVKHRFFSAYR